MPGLQLQTTGGLDSRRRCAYQKKLRICLLAVFSTNYHWHLRRLLQRHDAQTDAIQYQSGWTSRLISLISFEITILQYQNVRYVDGGYVRSSHSWRVTIGWSWYWTLVFYLRDCSKVYDFNSIQIFAALWCRCLRSFGLTWLSAGI
jgi:hypothetical protein